MHNLTYTRICATEDAPRNPCRLLERLHSFPEIIERGTGVREEHISVRGVLRAGAQESEARDVEREAAAPGALIDPFPRAPRTVLTSARFVDGITSV